MEEEINNIFLDFSKVGKRGYFLDTKIKSFIKSSNKSLLKKIAEEEVERYKEIENHPAYINLNTQWGQLDEDGISIAVSRQALEETIKMFQDQITRKKEIISKLD